MQTGLSMAKRKFGYLPKRLGDPKLFLNNDSQIAKLVREIHIPNHLLPVNRAIQINLVFIMHEL